ncbi:Polyadenylate-binding protein, cytoplasmic and nuclear [Termitomyces sp. J132]|nr:Polyadenylate-binding protein, cytoplasmic and nuclear [Termitomyces sp. J132]
MKAQFTNLYVKNIDPVVTQEEFENLFTPYGSVTSALLSVDDEGKSRGFGFVNYETHDEAQKAVDGLHDSEHNGRKLFVSRAQKKAEREEELRRAHEQARMEKLNKYQGVNLYIKNLEDDVYLRIVEGMTWGCYEFELSCEECRYVILKYDAYYLLLVHMQEGYLNGEETIHIENLM